MRSTKAAMLVALFLCAGCAAVRDPSRAPGAPSARLHLIASEDLVGNVSLRVVDSDRNELLDRSFHAGMEEWVTLEEGFYFVSLGYPEGRSLDLPLLLGEGEVSVTVANYPGRG